MTTPHILIAGIGNIFFGDDAFGVEVVRRLVDRPMMKGVRIIDFGIRGLDLAYALTDGYQAAILVDAVQRGGAAAALEGPHGPVQEQGACHARRRGNCRGPGSQATRCRLAKRQPR